MADPVLPGLRDIPAVYLIEGGMTAHSPSDTLVTVFGGSGFLGRHVVRALAARGYRIRVAVRRPDLAFHLQPLGRVGQIHAVQANVRYPDSLSQALRGADAAVNLVGVLAAMPSARILRPSVVFGPEDQFFNRFAAMAQKMPVLPLIGGGETRLQPVYVGDVAEAGARLLRGAGAAGSTYELGGPSIKTMREIFEFVLATIHRDRPLATLPFGLAGTIGAVTETLNKLLLGLIPAEFSITRDQVELLRHDNVVSQKAIAEGRTLAGLGLTPESVEAVVPAYLYRYRDRGQFADERVV